MRRRSFLAFGSAGLALAQGRGQRRAATFDCGCGFAPQPGRGARAGVARRVRAAAIRSESNRYESVRRFADAHVGPAVRILQARNQPGSCGMGRGHAGRQGRSDDGLHQRLPRVRHRRGPDAGGAHLAIDVRAQLLPRGTGDGLGDFGHRPGAVGYSRQSARRPRVPAAGRPARSARRSRLLSRGRRAHAGSAEEAARNGDPAGRFVLQDRPSRLTTSGSRRGRRSRRR